MPGLRRRRRQRRRGPRPRPVDRLPRADQGGRRRRRQGDAGLPRRGEPRQRPADGAQRGRGRVQEPERLPREVHRPAPPRRGPDPGRFPRQRRPLLGPRLLAPAAASEARRGGARPHACRWRSARSSARPPSGSPGPSATSTPAPASSSSTPRTSSTSSRSTPGSRSSTRSPRWSPASTWSSSRSGSPPASRLPFAQEEIVDPRPFHRVPDQLRGPRQRLPPLARPDHRAADPRRPGRALGLARPGRLHRPAQLRLARSAS